MLWCATLDKSFSLNVIPKQFQTSFYFRSPVSLSALTAATEVISSDIHVIVNGLPGPMALETAKACIDRGYRLLPFGFTGPSGTPSCLVQGKTSQVDVQLIKGPGIDTENAYSKLREWKSKYPSLVVIDYTHPSATLENAKCYSATNCDFVMGTTGGDPTELVRTVEASSITAVIAPNMGKQIVAMQAILQQMSKRFPGSFLGYDLSVSKLKHSLDA